MAEAQIQSSKDRIIHWITIFHNNGIIQDCTMPKKPARAIFKLHNKEKWFRFEMLLEMLSTRKYIAPVTNGSDVVFKMNEIDYILKNKQVLQGNGRKLIENVSYKCRICCKNFSSNNGLQSHVIGDRHHYFRTLYFSKSELITKTANCKSIKITVTSNSDSTTNSGYLFLNAGIETSNKIYIKNRSKDTVILEDIIEIKVNLDGEDIGIEQNQLPITITRGGRVSCELRSRIVCPVTTLFVVIYAFRKTGSTGIFLLSQEITIHVNSETYKDLHSTSKYVKPVRIRNDINTSKYVPLKAPPTYSRPVVKLNLYHIPSTLKVLLKAGLKKFKGISDDQKQYLRNVRALLHENDSGFYLTTSNYFELLHVLLYMEEYQLSIDIRNYDTETKNLVQVSGYNNRFRLMVPDLAERRPSLLQGDSVYVKSANSKTYQGVVRVMNQDSVILEFDRQFSLAVYTSGLKLSITYGYSRSIVRCEHRAVDLLDKHGVLAPFFPDKIYKTTISTPPKLHWFNQRIASNAQQQQAISHILARSSYPSPYLIFGPPGTGKTMTIVEAISQVWKTQPSTNILACAPSNSISNEIALRLTEYVPKTQLFRYMSMSFDMYNIPDKLLPYTNYDYGEFYTPTAEEICSHRIVVSTLSNASRLVSMGVPGGHFSYVFIDESGHATESETLLPVAGLLTKEGKRGSLLGQIVLAGDPKQLGPIIHSAHARQYGFGSSMLERLMTTVDIYKKNSSGKYNPKALTKLLNNYRSHPSILRLPNSLFYDKELLPMGGELVNLALDWHKLPNKQFPIIFHSVLGSDEREASSPSYFNVQEIQVVMEYLSDLIKKRLKGRVITEQDIGIVTPYRKQVQKIRKACEKKNWKELTIGSVEQFQGQERLIMIVSTVRSKPSLLGYDNKYHLGFLNSPKRFNVALTRAKALLIIVGNPNLLQHESYWKTFIQYCMDNRCMTGAPFKFASNSADLLALDMAKLRIEGEADDSIDFSRGNI